MAAVQRPDYVYNNATAEPGTHPLPKSRGRFSIGVKIVPFAHLIQQINASAEANPQAHPFASFVQRRQACIPIGSNMPLVPTNNPDDPDNPTRAKAGTIDELQFNVALGHEYPGQVRAGLGLSFTGFPNVAAPGNPVRRRIPPVWDRLNQLAVRFPLPVRSIIWEGDDFEDHQGFHPVPGQPGNRFYFFGRFFQPWEDEPNAIAAISQEILEYFDQLMPIWEAVYCKGAWQQFLNERQDQMLGELQTLLEEMGQIILHGPPGTSKTFMAKRLCAKLVGLPPAAGTDPQHGTFLAAQGVRWDIVQFHPAYNYEDFVRGIQVSTDPNTGQVRYDTVNRVFADLCERATANPDQPHVLVIDEINRANLAAVLGELIYALEYRAQPVRIPYRVSPGGYSLTVPKNLYLIGTMNTADRSIGHIDYAVRRRFAFVPMLPKRLEIEIWNYADASVRTAALNLFDAVGALFGPDGALSPEVSADDVQPGHTYFFANDCDQLLRKFVYQVVPLLREYVKDGILSGTAEGLVITVPGIAPIALTQTWLASDLLATLNAALCPNAAPVQAAPADGAAQVPGGIDAEPVNIPNEEVD
jgi:MoxR-like ATPase